MYESLLEHYTFSKFDYDFTILRGRIAFTDIELRMHHQSSSIRVSMMDMPVYEGDYQSAPDLSPLNVLRLLHKVHARQFVKIKGSALYKMHVLVLKAYKDGYTLEGFRNLQAGEANVHSYRERLMTFVDNNSLSTYYLEVSAVNEKVGSSLVNQMLTLESSGKIERADNSNTKLSIYSNSVMNGLAHDELFDFFLQLDPVEDTIIMSRLKPYFRKRTIDAILTTLDDVPERPI